MQFINKLLAILLFASTAVGWGGEGHQITALIAEDRLTKKTQAAIHDLIGNDADISDAEIASWADQIKRERIKTKPWHYIDIPTTADGFDRSRDAKNANNLIDATTEQINILADATQPKEKRAEALKFVVHMIGDLHQPLHCAERDNDSGGNKVDVTIDGKTKPTNLHTVWDTDLIRKYVGLTKIAKYSESLSKKIKPEDIKTWSKGSIIDWANESHKAAVDVVYKDIPATGATITAKLFETYKPTVEQQLERGGVRLAEVLNNALDPKK